MKHMTAKVSCFARAFHTRENTVPVFADPAAELLLNEAYDAIAEHMIRGIGFFLPGFHGDSQEGLRRIVDRQLSPSVLARSAFCKEMLERAVQNGCRQYVILAAGYDTFGIVNRNSALAVYEADLPDLLQEKAEAVKKAGLHSSSIYVPCDLSDPEWKGILLEHGFVNREPAFVSLLGISYYLSPEDFSALLGGLASLLCKGSEICMDYPIKEEGKESMINRQLAEGAGEAMKAMYTEEEMICLLERAGFACRRIMHSKELTDTYFTEYNRADPGHRMEAPAGVSCLMAERKN